jgi:hypothetical protein
MTRCMTVRRRHDTMNADKCAKQMRFEFDVVARVDLAVSQVTTIGVLPLRDIKLIGLLSLYTSLKLSTYQKKVEVAKCTLPQTSPLLRCRGKIRTTAALYYTHWLEGMDCLVQ